MLIADLTHFLTPDGSIGPKDGPALRLAEYLTKIVVAATVSTETTVVHCRKRPNRRLCVGRSIPILTLRRNRSSGVVRCVGIRDQLVTGKVRYGTARTTPNRIDEPVHVVDSRY